MKVEMHSHTNYSKGKKILYDGVESPEAMVRRAKELGMGALAITDHNTMLGIKKAKVAGKKYGVMIIHGEEMHSLQGHVTALGIQETIRPGLSIFETVDQVHDQGGVAISVHPFDIKHDGLREHANACDAIEIFNGNNIDRISNIRAVKFANKNNMVAVAGSDAHTAAMIGTGIINTNATDVDGIIRAIKKGRIETEYTYPKVTVLMDYAVRRLKLSYDYTWKYMDENYGPTRKFFGKKMLSLVNKSPGSIDNLFKVFAYTTFAGVVTYSIWCNNIRK
ncbi:MAG: CehA/McbA family metallohydrolase [Candidatus Aenigmatarchaeota archaeon]